MTTAVLVVLALVVLALAAYAGVRWYRRHGAALRVRLGLPPAAQFIAPGLPRPEPRPVVLVHGILGFDKIRLPGLSIDYFRGVARHLDSLGITAHTVRLPPLASVPERARVLADFVHSLGTDRVDVIAHSLGGLDARWAIAHLGLAPKVASLVTVGTPHRGTPVADLALRGPFDLARKLVSAVGIDTGAIDWLTTEALARFNREVPDQPGVRYASVVAGVRVRGTKMPLALLALHAYLRKVAGANDGLVPLDSQVWGEVLGEIEADHWLQVGWSAQSNPGFDARAFYADVIARLQNLALPPGPSTTPLLLPAPAPSRAAGK